MHKMAGSQGGTAKKKRRTSRNFSTPVLHNSDVGSQHPECQMCNKSPFGDWSTFTVPGMPGMGLDGPGRLGLCCGSVDQASSGPVGMSFEGHGMMLSGFRPPMMVGHGEMIGPNHPIMMGHPDMQRPLFTPSDKVYPTHHPMIYNSHNPTGPPIYPCGVCRKEVNDNDQAILCESGCNFWFHRVCTGLSETAFYFLTQEIYAEWVCDSCFSTKQE